MNSLPRINSSIRGLVLALLVTAGFAFMTGPARAAHSSKVVPPHQTFRGKNYSQWSAAWWRWSLAQPLAGHPFVDDPSFNVASGQSGNVWFLATPFGTVTRQITVPRGKALFVGLLNGESSDLEGSPTEVEQRETAVFQADHIQNVSCTVDGQVVPDICHYRVASRQFSFNAPTPWIFGASGGAGRAVADGYYLMLKPLGKGEHIVRIRGRFHFAVAEGDPFDFEAEADVTYQITVPGTSNGSH